MAVVAGLAALVWVIVKETEAEKQWNKRIDDNVKAMDELVESTNEFLATRKQALEGWSQEEVRIKGVNAKLADNHAAMQQALVDMKTWYDTAPTKDIYDQVYPTDKIIGFYRSLFKAQDAQILLTKLHKADAATKEKAFAEEVARQKKKEEDEKDKGKGKGFTGDLAAWAEAENARLDRQEQLEDERLDRQADAHLKMLGRMAEDEKRLQQEINDEEVKQQEDHMWRLIALKEKEEDAKRELERETREAGEAARAETTMNAIGLFEELGTMMAASEEQRTAIKIIAIIAEAAYQSAMEIAKGVASIETPWIAAAHFTAAALFAAIAAGNVAAAASGGGVASAGSRSSFQSGSSAAAREVKREYTIIVNLGGKEAGRAVHDVLEGFEDEMHPNRFKPRVD